MKVILLKNVPKIGQKGDIKDVKEGYVRNMLLPRGLAKIATAGDLINAEKMTAMSKEHEEAKMREIYKLFDSASDKIVTIKEKASDKGHLFAKINLEQILSAVKAQLGIELESSWVTAPEHLKEIGQHKIGLHFKNKKGQFILEVVALK